MACLALCSVDLRVCASDFDLLLFGSLDAGRPVFATGGAKIGLETLGQDGPTALLSAGGGGQVYRERRGGGRVIDGAAEASALIGYQWFIDQGVIAAFAGPEILTKALIRRSGTVDRQIAAGLRVQAEVWLRPTDVTLLQATLIVGTSRPDAWARLAWGYRAWDAYLGPEASLYADTTAYRKWSVGLHATDFQVFDLSMRLSLGVAGDGRRTGRAGPYATLAVWAPW